MKKLIAIFSLLLILKGCALITPRDDLYIGMSEDLFLRRHREAVISELNDNQKIYRLQRGERFYALVTFTDEKLARVEEREILLNQWPADSTRRVH